MEILAIVEIISIIIFIIIYLNIKHIKHTYARNKQIEKNMEMMGYHFWLIEIGLKETAFMFNEFGLSVSLGEEV